MNTLQLNLLPLAFSEIVGDVSLLASVKYVITLDTDTQLPRDAARALVATIAHPLNRPDQCRPVTVFPIVRGGVRHRSVHA
jgi:hypothetical protein